MFCEDKNCPLYIKCMESLKELPYCASKGVELTNKANQQVKDIISQAIGMLRDYKREDAIILLSKLSEKI